jgi:hypothetical protein
MNSKNPTIPEILYAGLIKLGITDQEHLKVILLTLQTEDNMAGMIARIEERVDTGEKMDWSEALKTAIMIREEYDKKIHPSIDEFLK